MSYKCDHQLSVSGGSKSVGSDSLKLECFIERTSKPSLREQMVDHEHTLTSVGPSGGAFPTQKYDLFAPLETRFLWQDTHFPKK